MYILQYPESNLSVSFGILENLYGDKEYDFRHKCSTRNGSSGSPILNLNNNKIIGIHKKGKSGRHNIGTFLNYPIKDFINKNINKIEKKELNNEIIDKAKIKINNQDKRELIDLSKNISIEKYTNLNLGLSKDGLSNKVKISNQHKFKIDISQGNNNKNKEELKDLSKNFNKDLCSVKGPFIQKKKSNVNLLNLLNGIFFKNIEQTIINTQKIDDNHLKILREEYLKHINEEKNIVYIYVNNFIKSNCLKLFKKNIITKIELEIIKVKISSVIECIGMNKDYYLPYCIPNQEYVEIKSLEQSVKAAKSFREEFGVNEKDINPFQLINYLNENDNDIYQTFGQIFGK